MQNSSWVNKHHLSPSAGRNRWPLNTAHVAYWFDGGYLYLIWREQLKVFDMCERSFFPFCNLPFRLAPPHLSLWWPRNLQPWETQRAQTDIITLMSCDRRMQSGLFLKPTQSVFRSMIQLKPSAETQERAHARWLRDMHSSSCTFSEWMNASTRTGKCMTTANS